MYRRSGAFDMGYDVCFCLQYPGVANDSGTTLIRILIALVGCGCVSVSGIRRPVNRPYPQLFGHLHVA